MSGMDQHTGTPAAKTAEQYRQTADEHVRTLKDFWKDFLVSGLFVLAAIVIIFACLAWFAANNSANATGSSISAKGARYYISTTGTNKGYYEQNDGQGGINLGGLDVTDSMLVAEGSNLDNWTKGELAPGSYGSITFTVTPLVDDLRGVTVSISRNIKAERENSSAEDIAKIKALLSGHILFFEAWDKDSGFYSKPILNDSIEIDSSEFGGSKKKPVTKTLYWVWPVRLRNIIAPGGNRYDLGLFLSDTSDGYASLVNDLGGNRAKYFNDPSALANVGSISNSMSNADYTLCSNQYDAADEYIGSSVQYVQVRFAADEAPASDGANTETGGQQ